MKAERRNRKVIITAIIVGAVLLAGVITASVLLTRDDDTTNTNPWIPVDTENVPASLRFDVATSLVEAGCSDTSGVKGQEWLNSLLSNDEQVVLVKLNVIITKTISSNSSAAFQVYYLVNGTLIPQGDQLVDPDFTPTAELSLDLSNDGSTLVVGNPDYFSIVEPASGFVQAYRFNGTNWIEYGNRILGQCDGSTGCSPCTNEMYHDLGHQVKVNANGTRLVVSAPQAECVNGPLAGNRGVGFVRIYDMFSSSTSGGTDDSWIQVGNDIVRPEPELGSAVQEFGGSLSLSSDGTKIAIGSDDGMCGVFYLDNGVWEVVGNYMWDFYAKSDSFFHRQYISLSGDGNRVAVGADTLGEKLHHWGDTEKEGTVRILEWTNGVWIQVGDDLVGPRGFGHTVGLSPDGDILAVLILQENSTTCQVFSAPIKD